MSDPARDTAGGDFSNLFGGKGDLAAVDFAERAAPRGASTVSSAIDRLFVYIWKNSRREQIAILALVLLSFPFYYVSLDIPKTIVNEAIQGHAFKHGREHALLFHTVVGLPQWLGGWSVTVFPGIEFSRLPYLLALSFAFLGLTLVNGAFKYVINMQKGKLGERVLQRLRFDLFSLLLRFSPEAIRNVKASEVATIIKDEVEPIGNFVGDAFVQPVFLGGQAITALLFIILQSPMLGAIAFFMVAIQGVLIPRMRREQLRLGKLRQLESRALAGRIGEIVEGMPEVENHGTSPYERHRISAALEVLFRIRYQLYGRKFMVKFVNNMLAQITPFLFYSIGGYLALRGSLDIGQLVAVIAAYRDLPPPVKELIDWDQQRLDVHIKYAQVVEQFSGGRMRAADGAPLAPFAGGTIEAQGLRVTGSGGEVLLDGINASIPLGAHTALLATAGDGAAVLAQVIGRRIGAYQGKVSVAGHDLATLTGTATAPHLTYAGPTPVIFQGSIRDNVLYGLNRRRDEAVWIDYAAAGASGPDDIDGEIVRALRLVGMDEPVYRFGLGRRIDPKSRPELAAQVVEARRALRAALDTDDARDLIETFDPALYNRNSTIGENLVFGVAQDADAVGDSFINRAFMRTVLERHGLIVPLIDMGLEIAELTVELFSGLSDQHFLFEQFSFVSTAELAILEEIVARTRAAPLLRPNGADAVRLIELALVYVEPRHRLNLLSPDIMDRVLLARADVIAVGAQGAAGAIEFYDPDRYCAAAPLRDNLLFGRIAYGRAGAGARVITSAQPILAERGLEREIYRLGLDQPTGPAGRLLFPSQNSAIGLARCLIKRPDILVLDEATSAFGEVDAKAILQDIRAEMAGRTLLVVTRDAKAAANFDGVVAIDSGRIKAGPTSTEPTGRRSEAASDTGGGAQASEFLSLRAVPMFADIDAARLKLMAFASERVLFTAGQTVFRQGDASDSVYVVMDGSLDVMLETGAERLMLAHVGANAILGEMGVISGAPRSATVVAHQPTAALRLSRDILLGLIDEFPQIARALLRDQIQRTRTAEGRLAAAQAAASQDSR